jgi:hypothetical protein
MQPASSLHSALFNYTPFVTGGTAKNKQLTIIKPTQTVINRKKINFLHYKIIGAPKKFKKQPRSIVRPSSVNFCHNLIIINLSHETVPLKLATNTDSSCEIYSRKHLLLDTICDFYFY